MGVVGGVHACVLDTPWPPPTCGGHFLEAPRAQLCAACPGWVSVGSGGPYLPGPYLLAAGRPSPLKRGEPASTRVSPAAETSCGTWHREGAGRGETEPCQRQRAGCSGRAGSALGQQEAGAPGGHRAMSDSQRARDQGHKGECPLECGLAGDVPWALVYPSGKLWSQEENGTPAHTGESPVSIQLYICLGSQTPPPEPLPQISSPN